MIQIGSPWVKILNPCYSQDNIKSVFKTKSLELLPRPLILSSNQLSNFSLPNCPSHKPHHSTCLLHFSTCSGLKFWCLLSLLLTLLPSICLEIKHSTNCTLVQAASSLGWTMARVPRLMSLLLLLPNPSPQTSVYSPSIHPSDPFKRQI